MDLFELIGLSGKSLATLTTEEIAELQTKIIEKNRQLSANNEKNIPIQMLLDVDIAVDIEEIIVQGNYTPEDYEKLNLIEGAINLDNIDFIVANAALIALENLDWEKISFAGKNEDKIIPFLLKNIQEIDLSKLALSNMSPRYVERLSTDPIFQEKFDYTTYAIRHDVDIDFLKKYKSFIDWNVFSKKANISKDFLEKINNDETIIILLNSSIIEERDDIKTDAKNIITSILSRKKQEAMVSFNELLQEIPHVDQTYMLEWIEKGYDPKILAGLSDNARKVLLEAASKGLDIEVMSKKLRTVPNVKTEQIEAYMTGLKYGVDINLDENDSIHVILEKINSKRNNKIFEQYFLAPYRREGHNITKEQADAFVEFGKIFETHEQMKEYGVPSVHTSPEILAEITAAIEYNLERNENEKTIPLDILKGSNFNAEQMKLYRLAFMKGLEVSPEDILKMPTMKVIMLTDFIEKGYEVTRDYLTTNLHYKNFYKEHPELRPTMEEKKAFSELFAFVSNALDTIVKTIRDANLNAQIPHKEENIKEPTREETESTSEQPNKTNEEKSATEEIKVEEPKVEKDKETEEETQEIPAEETVTEEKEKTKESAENPKVEKENSEDKTTVTGRGKILTREDVEKTVSRIEIDASVLAINEQIADLVASTILTQEEFDTMTWPQLAKRFEQDVDNINKALQLIKSVQDGGSHDLDYIDVKALIALRNTKIEQQKFAENFFSANRKIQEATRSAKDVQNMMLNRANQEMEQNFRSESNPLFELLPPLFQTSETNITLTDNKKGLYFELCGIYKDEQIKFTCLYDPEKERYIMSGNTKNGSSMQLMYDPNTQKINRVRTSRTANEKLKETDVIKDPITGEYRIKDRRQVKDERLQSMVENFFVENHEAIIQHYNELLGNTREVKTSEKSHVDTPEQMVAKKMTDYMMNAIAKPLGINTSEIKIIDSGDSAFTVEVENMIKIKFTADKENPDTISSAILSDTTKGKAQIIADVLSNQILPKNFNGIKFQSIKIKKPAYEPESKKLLETAEIESDRITKTIQDELCSILGKNNFSPENVMVNCKDDNLEIFAVDNSGKETKYEFKISDLMSAKKEKEIDKKDFEKRLRNLLIVHKTQIGHLQAASEISNYKNILVENIPTLKLSQLKIDLNLNCVQIGGQFKLGVDSLVLTGNFDTKNPETLQTIKLNANGSIEIIKGELDISQLSELQKMFIANKDRLITGFSNEMETKYNKVMYKDSSKSPESFIVEIQKAYNLEEIPVVENIEIEKPIEESKETTERTEKPVEHEKLTKENTPNNTQMLVETQIHNLRRSKERQIDEALEGIIKGKTPSTKAIKMKLEKNLKPETITIDGIDFECTFKVDAIPNTNPPEFSPKITITPIGGAPLYSEDKIILSEEDEITFRGKLSDIVEYIDNQKALETTGPKIDSKDNIGDDER